MKEKIIYQVAAYLRLSKEDTDIGFGKLESDSIMTQRDFIDSFVREHDNMEIYSFYIDSGYSGTSFERPQFKQMIKDVKEGKINCIIVKDLSRFGRDYIEVGQWVQKIFPALSVRFIAITDQFDTLMADNTDIFLRFPIKNFINESYSRDISQKVRSHQEIKRERGEFIGAFTVYGYKKDPQNKNQLIPDEYAADIVRYIFKWRICGMSMSAIARRLNDKGILSPLEYKKAHGENFTTGFVTGVKSVWSTVAVKRILENEIYTGTMIQGKSKILSYKIKKVIQKSEEEWVQVKNTHKAIISRAEFEAVASMTFTDCRAGVKEERAHIFVGILFCGDCKEPLIRRMNHYKDKKILSFICPTRNKGLECSRHHINETALKTIVIQGIQKQISIFQDRDKIIKRILQMDAEKQNIEQFNQELAILYKEKENYLKLLQNLYEDFKCEILTKEDFCSFKAIYEKKYQRTLEIIEKQQQTKKKLRNRIVNAEERLKKYKKVFPLKECNRELLTAFVNRIEVYEEHYICIELKNKEEFSKALIQQK